MAYLVFPGTTGNVTWLPGVMRVKGLVPVCVATAKGVPPMKVTVTFVELRNPVGVPLVHPVIKPTRMPETARTAAPQDRMHPPSFLAKLASLTHSTTTHCYTRR